MIAYKPSAWRLFFGDQAENMRSFLKAKQKKLLHEDIKGRHYRKIVDDLPELIPSHVDLSRDQIRIGCAADLDPRAQESLRYGLECLKPWRKGPFEIFGIDIDSEWRSDMKWNRLKDHISPLAHKRVLDIGSSNGYYQFKMMDHAPKAVVGIEPYLTFYFQYQALQRYLRFDRVCCLPIKLDAFPTMPAWFDTVFCMGILYHQRSPIDALIQIRANLKKGGELVLETLVIEGETDMALFPVQRYAKMRNVYFIPTVKCLCSWLERAGFENIRCIDVTKTTFDEQRHTDWIDTESLPDFLCSNDLNRTIEGYPAPIRAILLASAKL